MGIFNDHGSSTTTTDSKGQKGNRGPPGNGFKLDSDGNYDMQHKKISNLADPTEIQDGVNYMTMKAQTLLLDGSNHMTKALNMSGNDIINSGDIVMQNKLVKQMGNPVGDQDGVNLLTLNNVKQALQAANNNKLSKNTDIDMGRKKILNLDTDDSNFTAVNNQSMKNTIEKETKLHLKTDAIGNLNMRNKFISNLHDSDSETDGTNLRSVKILLSGIHGDIGKLNTDIDLNNNKIINIKTPTEANDACNKSYVDSQSSSIDLSEPLDSDLNMGGNLITFLKEPTQDNEAATKSYIDVGLAEKVNKSELDKKLDIAGGVM